MGGVWLMLWKPTLSRRNKSITRVQKLEHDEASAWDALMRCYERVSGREHTSLWHTAPRLARTTHSLDMHANTPCKNAAIVSYKYQRKHGF